MIVKNYQVHLFFILCFVVRTLLCFVSVVGIFYEVLFGLPILFLGRLLLIPPYIFFHFLSLSPKSRIRNVLFLLLIFVFFLLTPYEYRGYLDPSYSDGGPFDDGVSYYAAKIYGFGSIRFFHEHTPFGWYYIDYMGLLLTFMVIVLIAGIVQFFVEYFGTKE